MKRTVLLAGMAVVAALAMTVSSRAVLSHDDRDDGDDGDASRIRKGFEISPVRLSYHRRNRNLVGLGSYIVNAQSGCNDCHTCPSYAESGFPFDGQPTKINKDNYLAGGVAFGPFVVSANLTPHDDGKPAGLSFQGFKMVMRKGHDPEDPPGDILQVMPWPIFGNMTDHDLRAVYEFLRAIPPAQPGPHLCLNPGSPSPS